MSESDSGKKSKLERLIDANARLDKISGFSGKLGRLMKSLSFLDGVPSKLQKEMQNQSKYGFVFPESKIIEKTNKLERVIILLSPKNQGIMNLENAPCMPEIRKIAERNEHPEYRKEIEKYQQAELRKTLKELSKEIAKQVIDNAIPVLEIWQICIMLLPPPYTQKDRRELAKHIIFSIECWGMSVAFYPYRLTDFRVFAELNLSRKLTTKIHIDKFEEFAIAGKVTEESASLALDWREHIRNHEKRLLSRQGVERKADKRGIDRKKSRAVKNNPEWQEKIDALKISHPNKKHTDLARMVATDAKVKWGTVYRRTTSPYKK